MKSILMIATGGTIASRKTSDGLTPQLSPEELLQLSPRLEQLCHIDTIEVCNLDSTNIFMPHWLQIARAIEEHYDDYDGFVVCHGTDTMAYTAAALSYLIQNSPKPIVLTGSQKPIDFDISDARANLSDSFLYATHNQACGVQIVFSGKVIAATRARKVRTKSFQAFTSVNYPYLALVQDGRVVQYIQQDKAERATFFHEMNPRVGLLKLIPGVDGDYVRYYLSRSDALVIESFGVGGLPTLESLGFAQALDDGIRQGKTIVMTTQVPNEGSDMTVYQVGNHLKKYASVLEAFDMTCEAVLTKLMWILAQTNDAQDIRKLFYTPIGRDILFCE